jgi:hypothetical protein
MVGAGEVVQAGQHAAALGHRCGDESGELVELAGRSS